MTELEKCELAKSKGYTYNPITGEIRGVRGGVMKNVHYVKRYIQICIVLDKNYNIYGHRLAWFLHYGKLPAKQLDHIDNNRSNNKICNLREVTNQQNQFNNSKAKGYTWNKRDKRFQAQIRINGVLVSLGNFINEEEARNAYLEAKKIYHVIPK